MSENKYLLYSLITLSFITVAFLIQVKHFNVGITLNDDIWMGIAFFSNYLLLSMLYKPSHKDALRNYKEAVNTK
ncbi:MAG: hypothetical protein WAU15_13680 [Nitrosomonas sp.]